MKFEITQEHVNNIMIFLNRSEVKGFDEIQAMNEIVHILNNPVQEETTAVKASTKD